MIENCKLNRRGSILITVLVIGTILISAYFFFATRQLAKAKAQSETMEYRNQKAYLESYIDYLTEHPQVMSNQEFDNGAIIVDFLSNNADIISKMMLALNKNDNEALKEYAHSLKGSAANIGAESLADLAQNLENAAMNHTVEKVLIEDIKFRLEEVFTSILSLAD